MSAFRVLFFGRVSDTFGPEREVDLDPAGVTVSTLRGALGVEALAGARAAVNREIVTDDATVRPGDEVAFFSALSGG